MTSVAMVGPGSVGVFFAGQLANAGVDVLACARRPFSEYVVESTAHPLRAPANVVTDPAAVNGPVDIVLFCVKTHQTAGAAGWLDRLCGPDTTVVVIQNGLEAVERVTPFAGSATVLPGVVYCGAELLSPGHIRHSADSRLFMPPSPEAERVKALFDGTACTILPTDAFVTELWRKLGANCLLNGVMALTGRTMELYADDALATLGTALLTENWNVGRADGADLDLSFARVMVDAVAKNVGGVTSMLQDRRAGRSTEHDALYGAVVRAGARLGVPTPIHATIDALLSAWD